MDVLVVSGFLGSGKTTFLLSTLRVRSRNATRTAVIENEVGQVAIDGAVLRAQGAGNVPVRELYAGCICCTLRSDLTSAIEGIRRDHDPHLLLLEPSGIAGPDMVVESVRSTLHPGEGENVTSIQIVDARRVAALLDAGRRVPPFLGRSVQVCDLVILNKTDDLDRRQRDGVHHWVSVLGARDIHQVDVRSTDAVRQFLEVLEERESSPPNTMSFRKYPTDTSGSLHHETLASATMTIPVDEQTKGTVVKKVRDLICGVAREVERRFPGAPGHIKGFLTPPGIAFNVAGEGDGVTVSGGALTVPAGETTLSIQVILAGETPEQTTLQQLLDGVLEGEAR